VPFATGTDNDLYTYVSSPLTDTGPTPVFLVSWERQLATPEMIVRMFDGVTFGPLGSEVNLTRSFGFSGIYCRVESDGSRFAATCKTDSRIFVGTLARIGNDLVLHDPPAALGTGSGPAIASKRSGGGRSTEYGVTYLNESFNPDRTVLGLYEGRSISTEPRWRATGCNNLFIDLEGGPFLGRDLRFLLGNVRTDTTGLLLGLPAPPTPWCGSCSLGLDLNFPIVAFPAPQTMTIPTNPTLVGLVFAVQGYGFGSGPCNPGGLRLSDTIDFTIM
jgi:hypothetical protein